MSCEGEEETAPVSRTDRLVLGTSVAIEDYDFAAIDQKRIDGVHGYGMAADAAQLIKQYSIEPGEGGGGVRIDGGERHIGERGTVVGASIREGSPGGEHVCEDT
jgi:hypothetical protein